VGYRVKARLYDPQDLICGRREGLRFKKTLFALEQARADIARRRRRWRSWQASLDPRRLVFIRRDLDQDQHGPAARWGPKGNRLRGFAPYGHWRTLTFLGAKARVARGPRLVDDERFLLQAGAGFVAMIDNCLLGRLLGGLVRAVSSVRADTARKSRMFAPFEPPDALSTISTPVDSLRTYRETKIPSRLRLSSFYRRSRRLKRSKRSTRRNRLRPSKPSPWPSRKARQDPYVRDRRGSPD
jgi:hypothetical protein